MDDWPTLREFMSDRALHLRSPIGLPPRFTILLLDRSYNLLSLFLDLQSRQMLVGKAWFIIAANTPWPMLAFSSSEMATTVRGLLPGYGNQEQLSHSVEWHKITY